VLEDFVEIKTPREEMPFTNMSIESREDISRAIARTVIPDHDFVIVLKKVRESICNDILVVIK
jgi:hypothetical protein